VANALLAHLGRQAARRAAGSGNLTDSTVPRNVGSALAYSLLGWNSLQRGLGKLELAPAHSQPIWSKTRKASPRGSDPDGDAHAVPEPYEKLKDTHARTTHIRKCTARLHRDARHTGRGARLAAMTPGSHTGNAAEQAQRIRAHCLRGRTRWSCPKPKGDSHWVHHPSRPRRSWAFSGKHSRIGRILKR
jgi:adenylosuccinate lyase